MAIDSGYFEVATDVNVPSKWLYSSTEDPVFRICPKCGRAYRIAERECPYNFCPNCGEPLEE